MGVVGQFEGLEGFGGWQVGRGVVVYPDVGVVSVCLFVLGRQECALWTVNFDSGSTCSDIIRPGFSVYFTC